ncbi:WD40-repeat-containing domain protein [Thamnocephalis sphaerospora]|uniref:WD40-repeat-containing domain protein n=1 Tax=Thamnocephalis sphaerospora TaxID=78915 RepID=A0A4P9XK85_9FUNG|nr:WD40-repeat-containing domain protein [Thamnocephalis sphaerospora]|eukprot:RKP06156.1 WD40-repeat-containing domain protein [Thamnocephalis sphaerospora]
MTDHPSHSDQGRGHALFDHFRLRRLVRENHGTAITQLAVHSRHPNLVATVGANQASVYDNEHCGNHLDIVTNYTAPASAAHTDDEPRFTCCAWLRVHPHPMDAWLAIGGHDGVIRLLSIARSAEFRRLGAPTAAGAALPALVELQSHPTLPVLLAAYADGSVRYWRLDDERDVSGAETSAETKCSLRLTAEDCQRVWRLKASALYISADGTYFLAGTRTGEIRRVMLPEALMSATTMMADNDDGELLMQPHYTAIDCISMADDDAIVSKSASGKLVIGSLGLREVVRTVQLHDENIDTRSRFGLSGDSQGRVTVYQRYTGEVLREFHHRRANRPVLCCAFAREDRNLLVVGEDGCIWRWDYVDDATLAEWAKFHAELQERQPAATTGSA